MKDITNEIEKLVEKSEDYLAYGKYKQAIDCYSKAMTLKRDDATLYCYRGNAYMSRNGNGDLDSAINDYNTAIELDEKTVNPYIKFKSKVYFNRGLAYSQKGESKKAMMDYYVAARLEPNLDSVLDPMFATEIRLDPILIIAYILIGKRSKSDTFDEIGSVALYYTTAIELGRTYIKMYHPGGFTYKASGNIDNDKASLIKTLKFYKCLLMAHRGLNSVYNKADNKNDYKEQQEYKTLFEEYEKVKNVLETLNSSK